MMKQAAPGIAHGLSDQTDSERFGDAPVLRNAVLKESSVSRD